MFHLEASGSVSVNCFDTTTSMLSPGPLDLGNAGCPYLKPDVALSS